MKILNKTLIFLLLIATVSLTQAQRDCSNTSTGNIPINDLGTDTFMGYQGGLYPEGSNTMPMEHRSAGYQIGKSIRPLDTAGNVNMDEGAIVFAAIGASTAGNTFSTFKKTVKGDTLDRYNKCIKFIDMSFGGKGLETMTDPEIAWYWDVMRDSVLAPAGLTPAQVQIAWMKTGSKTDTIVEFPLQADSIYQKYTRAVLRLKDSFPNLKLLYLTSHAYGGYAGDSSNNVEVAGEPAAYYGGFSVKWLIGDQVSGDMALRFNGPNPQAPWMAWAPYYWADGTTPRSTDGLTWECDDYSEYEGGFHLSNQGKDKEAQMMIDFFYTDASSKKWFRNANRWTSCSPSARLASGEFWNDENPTFADIFPSPNNGVFTYNVSDSEGFTYLRVFNHTGQLIYERNVDGSAANQVNIDLGNANSGLYYLVSSKNGQNKTTVFSVVK